MRAFRVFSSVSNELEIAPNPRAIPPIGNSKSPSYADPNNSFFITIKLFDGNEPAVINFSNNSLPRAHARAHAFTKLSIN